MSSDCDNEKISKIANGIVTALYIMCCGALRTKETKEIQEYIAFIGV